ncbi:hypothetical protein [uncultured Flavobacterium sp.]|uniref:hypothetical protein n=1 Tax=uncultured Flavobacterium sp. TaxID=165435 RepID=UPI0025E9642D|nr:hypothetical protein [uncultured Flavobacterium sp.]
MKKIIVFISGLLFLLACEGELSDSIDAAQKPVQVKIKGYSSPDSVELKLNGKPVLINQESAYTGNIETTLQFVSDKGENDQLSIRNRETGNELATYDFTYENIDDYQEIYFFNLPNIFLETYAVKPTVNLGKVGFVFLFPNLGEFSGSELETIKGVLKRENGTVLAEFGSIGKENFSELKIYNFFSATAPVFLELYKPGTTEPYAGSEPIRVRIIQNIGANMIVLQEKLENGNLVIKGDIDIADYLN